MRLAPDAGVEPVPDFPDSPTRGNQEIVIRQGRLGHVLDISTYSRTGEDTCRPCSGNPSTETSKAISEPPTRNEF